MNTPFSFNQLNDVLHDEVRAFPTNCERWSPNTLEEEKHTKRKPWKIQEAGQVGPARLRLLEMDWSLLHATDHDLVG